MVPCTCAAPASTATRELATAQPLSLWAWMPTAPGAPPRPRRRRRRRTAAGGPVGVAQATTAAPASAAAVAHRSAYSGSSRQPSKKCSASRKTACPAPSRKRTESSTMRRFSSRLTRSTLVTCRSQVLPTMATVAVKISASTRRSRRPRPRVLAPGRAEGDEIRVAEPLARMRPKNSMSLGLDPGKPPSMKWMPSTSSLTAMRTLSSTESDMPSRCVPSRRVVS